jgi:ParB family transcriptional regulator, chromosome partitioning protein
MTAIRRRSLQVDNPLSSTTDQDRDPGSTFGAAVGGRLREIPVEQISANPAQPRKRFEEESLASLADSIREGGVLQPIIVRPSGQGYELVAGERRWRAAQLAGQATVPALVDLNLDQAESLELALIENIAREDLTPIEQARTLATLQEDLRLTPSVLAKRLGRSRSDIANTVRLLELPDEAIALIDSGELSKGHGKVLLTEPDHGRRRDLARRAVQGRLVSSGARDGNRPSSRAAAGSARLADQPVGRHGRARGRDRHRNWRAGPSHTHSPGIHGGPRPGRRPKTRRDPRPRDDDMSRVELRRELIAGARSTWNTTALQRAQAYVKAFRSADRSADLC